MESKENLVENNIFYYLNIFKKWKKFLIISVSLVTAIALVISLLLPVWYYSYSVVKPADDGRMNMFSALLGAKGLTSIGKNLNVGGLQYSDLDYYQALLSSRKITTSIIDKYELMEIYDQKYLFKTINQLLDNSIFQADPKANLLIIGVYDKDPERARRMVESYLELLNQTVNEVSKSMAIANSEIIESRYTKNRSDLENADNMLREFQEKYKVIMPEEQFITTIKSYAELEAQKIVLETQAKALELVPEKNFPLIANIKEQIDLLNGKLSKFKYEANNTNDLIISSNRAPEIINEYIKLYREVEIQTKLLEILYPIYEQSRMETLKDSPALIIIDAPFLPEYKAKPKRAVMVLAAFLISSVIFVSFVFLVDYLQRIKKKYV